MGTSLRELDAEVEPIARWFVSLLTSLGLHVTINSVRRDLTEQQVLYDNYRRCGCSSCPPRAGHCFPAAEPGHSPHALGIAWDMSISPPQYQRWAGQLWERVGFRWGGRFSQPDPVHFDFHPVGWTG